MMAPVDLVAETGWLSVTSASTTPDASDENGQVQLLVEISPLPCDGSCQPPPHLAVTGGEPLTLLLPLLLLTLGGVLVRRWVTRRRRPTRS